MRDREFLEKIKSGQMSIEEGEKYIQDSSYQDMGFAKIDFQRKNRRGFPEVIFCQGKEDFALIEIFKAFRDRGENALGTRAKEDQYQKIKREIPEIEYDPVSKTLSLKYQETEKRGLVGILTGGTADLKIAEEARITCDFFGARTETFYDVGVSGVHRLFSKIEEIRKCNCLIAIAGMEGTLPTLVAGLVDIPIIAVPTSIGYGANFSGLSSLLAMLTSCAEGISVVNIDNGYGAAYQACQINRLIEE